MAGATYAGWHGSERTIGGADLLMRLTREDARSRLALGDHGILCTLHPSRGVDAVPCVFAIDGDGFVGMPVDRVKEKASSKLRRVRNLELDPRATLLVEQWDRADWSRLWWVRASLEWHADPSQDRTEELAALLRGRYAQYSAVDDPFAGVLVFRLLDVRGWSAT